MMTETFQHQLNSALTRKELNEDGTLPALAFSDPAYVVGFGGVDFVVLWNNRHRTMNHIVYQFSEKTLLKPEEVDETATSIEFTDFYVGTTARATIRTLADHAAYKRMYDRELAWFYGSFFFATDGWMSLEPVESMERTPEWATGNYGHGKDWRWYVGCLDNPNSEGDNHLVSLQPYLISRPSYDTSGVAADRIIPIPGLTT